MQPERLKYLSSGQPSEARDALGCLNSHQSRRDKIFVENQSPHNNKQRSCDILNNYLQNKQTKDTAPHKTLTLLFSNKITANPHQSISSNPPSHTPPKAS